MSDGIFAGVVAAGNRRVDKSAAVGPMPDMALVFENAQRAVNTVE